MPDSLQASCFLIGHKVFLQGARAVSTNQPCNAGRRRSTQAPYVRVLRYSCPCCPPEPKEFRNASCPPSGGAHLIPPRPLQHVVSPALPLPPSCNVLSRRLLPEGIRLPLKVTLMKECVVRACVHPKKGVAARIERKLPVQRSAKHVVDR